MASQVDYKNIWRCGDFQERVDKFCATLAENKGRLIVITDFDRTLSAYAGVNGQSCDECHDIVFRHCCPDDRWEKEVADLWSQTAVAFEGLVSKPPDEQTALFDWWWGEANRLMTSHGLKRADIEQAVEKANTLLRPGCKELFHECAEGGVPIVISSAGLYDVFLPLLRRHGALPPAADAAAAADAARVWGGRAGPELHVHSNRMVFDSDGTLVGFPEPLVHCRVKARTYERLRSQLEPLWEGGKVPCALVLGDGPLDSTVLHGMPGPPVAVRVGYANRPAEDTPQFREAYDAVISGDGPLDLPLHILRRALAATSAAATTTATSAAAAASAAAPVSAAPAI